MNEHNPQARNEHSRSAQAARRLAAIAVLSAAVAVGVHAVGASAYFAAPADASVPSGDVPFSPMCDAIWIPSDIGPVSVWDNYQQGKSVMDDGINNVLGGQFGWDVVGTDLSGEFTVAPCAPQPSPPPTLPTGCGIIILPEDTPATLEYGGVYLAGYYYSGTFGPPGVYIYYYPDDVNGYVTVTCTSTPTATPTPVPTATPTPSPTAVPTVAPTATPTSHPETLPVVAPTIDWYWATQQHPAPIVLPDTP